MTDVLGPAAAGAVNTLTTTTDVSDPSAGDTWFQDCVANNPATGTNLPSQFMNRMLQQIRRLIRLTGVTLSNADDDMLGQAIQSGALNWAGTLGGTTNALSAAIVPVPGLLIPGMRVGGLAAFANTGPITLTLNGIGPTAVKGIDGLSPFIGGEIGAAGQEVEFVYTPTGWVMDSPFAPAFPGTVAPFVTLNNASQVLSNGVLTAVSCGASGTMPSVGSLSGGIFTFTRAGVYSVFMSLSGSMTVIGAAQCFFQLYFYHNGVDGGGNPGDLTEVNAAGTVSPALTTSLTLYCSVGDTLQVVTKFAAGSNFSSCFVNSCGMEIAIVK